MLECVNVDIWGGVYLCLQPNSHSHHPSRLVTQRSDITLLPRGPQHILEAKAPLRGLPSHTAPSPRDKGG